ncbi:glycerol acyltransferase [Flavobacteriaceae bacterium TP-CH-4]|uniref:Glycerol acyltransferase n=1 Tax=Pelagihabitans pacificus TaxID=2696054 RepID=A0A967AUL0_9FLAO|nr:lysophospholipid acyltransferase family protein [Pelagihabitans pacificus]NHF57882.1 glycerol acyltransferase [Pelagihabitans pacificus]
MRNLGYSILKFWIKSGFYLYYGKIQISGLEKVPKDKPVLFLPNHQSALMDVLLLAVDCGRKPYFLTRSDVFRKTWLKRFFTYLRMIPIYRIRDGREALKNNDAVFARCAEILERNQAILMFPEANHNIKRRVRPLSKGFTRILFGALDKTPNLDIQLVPVGLNYRSNTGFPDQVAVQFGSAIPVLPLYDKSNIHTSTNTIKALVAERISGLTTHIDDEATYDVTVGRLDALGVDYLKPSEVNDTIGRLPHMDRGKTSLPVVNGLKPLYKGIFVLANLPVVLLWWGWMKPKVWEREFTATIRFAFSLLALPAYYLFLFLSIALLLNPWTAIYSLLGLFLFNWAYVKLS